jgi:F-type H+-transporting ATPase subunit alpha
MPFARQVVSIFAGARGFLDDVPVERIGDFEHSLHRFLEQNHPDIEKDIAEKGQIAEETDKKLREAIEEFKRGFAG